MQPEYITLVKNAIDITGQRFGRLVALGPITHSPYGTVWSCQCDCGKTTTTLGTNLRNGNKQSCGCSRGRPEHLVALNTTHGLYGHPLHKVWDSIIQRCTNPKSGSYDRYGGRGISMCEEWRHDLPAFYDYVSALPHCGEKGYSLDRINNDGNYEPGNLRWATSKEQQRNTRLNVMLAHNGKIQCVAAWAEELGISARTLRYRLGRGWPIERALTPR